MHLKHSKTPNGSHAEVLFFHFLKYLKTILLSSSINLFVCCNEKQTFFFFFKPCYCKKNSILAKKNADFPTTGNNESNKLQHI